MSGIFKNRDEEQKEDSGSLDFDIPDVKNITEKLDKSIQDKEEIRRQHQEENDKEENKKGKNKKKQAQRQGGELCICESPYCRIGPMMQIEK